MKSKENKIEVLFKYHSPVLDEPIVETMWAEVVDEKEGLYRLESIPVYGIAIATGDEFHATYDEDEAKLMYRQTIKCSGNSIVVVVTTKEDFDKEPLRTELNTMGCNSENINNQYFAMEVPKQVFYGKVKAIFNKYEDEGSIDYAETYLSAKHQADLRRR